MAQVLQSPARYTQGRGATESLGDELRQIGVEGPVSILASPSPRKLLGDTWAKSLGDAKIDFEVETFAGECSPEEITRISALTKAAGATAIIGAGGGKVLDTSRAVASDLDIVAINCPTVASSDSPCSALSVIYDGDGQFLEYRFYRSNPALVLVDSAVIAQAPTRLLISGIGDALATWWEADAVRKASAPNQLHAMPTETGTALAELCYRLLRENSLEAVLASNAKIVTPALDRIIEANTLLSGLGFESGGLAAAHSVHNGLTTQGPTHAYLHGEKVSFGLVTQLVLEGRPRSVLDEVLELQLAVGLPVTLAEVGLKKVQPDQIRTIAERSLADGETIHHEPFEVTVDQLSDAIVAADAVGREAHASR